MILLLTFRLHFGKGNLVAEYSFFYQSHLNPFADDLYSEYSEEGNAPSPPGSNYRITDDDYLRITDAGNFRVTE